MCGRIPRFTDNALRCLMYLGTTGDRVVTVGEVASRMAMSEDHLLKVVRRLVELGYVVTVRGRRGGVRLATEPSRITVGDVVRATEENVALVPCFTPGDDSCPLTGNCALADSLDQALGAFFASLQRQTIADLIGSHPRPIVPAGHRA
jgi:Rrf2 family nitric oxide-sensitive transcriptional repressor